MYAKVLYYANEAFNKFGLTSDEIAVYIEGFVNRSYGNTYGHCNCVIVDQTVPDDTFVEQCSSRQLVSSRQQFPRYNNYSYYLCFALKGLKIGLHWDGRRY